MISKEVPFRVLICQEDGEFVARALEMDLLGFGKTEEGALNDLSAAISSQISFAIAKSNPLLLPFAAETQYFKRWEKARTDAMNRFIMGDKAKGGAFQVATVIEVPLPVRSERVRFERQLVPA